MDQWISTTHHVMDLWISTPHHVTDQWIQYEAAKGRRERQVTTGDFPKGDGPFVNSFSIPRAGYFGP